MTPATKRTKRRSTPANRTTRQKRAASAPAPSDGNSRIRVAIVGGGCAGLAAAWHLSKFPKYEISVFEQSWRLGGKGASGRTEDGRIVEHGLHVWLGFYQNAFAMIRECYDEVRKQGWGPDSPDPNARLAHGSFEDAFFPEPHIGVTGFNTGRDVVWSGFFPPEKGIPGDPLDAETNPFTLASYLLRCVQLLKTLAVSEIAAPTENVPGHARPDSRSALDQAVDLNFSFDPTRSPEVLIQTLAKRARDGTLAAAAALLQGATIVENILQDLNHSPQVIGSILNVLRAIATQARKQLRDVVAIDGELRWKTEIIDIVMTIAVGLYRDRVLLGERGLDALNDVDYREWLRRHGATNSSLESRFITGIYDLVFAYGSGDRGKPKLAAGVALRGALRMFFTYRGAMFWRMRSGMGDAVFAPLYKVLILPERRHPVGNHELKPVHFHFRHELTGVRVERSGGLDFVTRLTFRTAAEVAGGARAGIAAERPVLDHFGCWPNVDPYAKTGPASSTDCHVQKDFDFVIFATDFERFKALVAQLAASNTAPKSWRRAADAGKTVATKTAQVWLERDLEELGWFRGSGIFTALGLPFDTWADMTHTLASERAWRSARPRERATSGRFGKAASADAARSVAYFCGLLSDDQARASAKNSAASVREVEALLTGMSRLWPDFDARKDRPIEMHVQNNAVASDRYSLSLPGTIRNRLSPLDSSLANATVAGDWTACGLDVGCVEAAVMSGMLAAHAITGGEPSLESIVGYDHP
jgi:uncharacterized protein with NAD-binding domain and iron-sulfur cluster